MLNFQLFKRIVTLLVIVLTLDVVAFIFYLHWTLWWYDPMLHFLGGISLGMTAILFGNYLLKFASRGQRQKLFVALSFCLCVGVAWEIYEILFNLTSFADGIVYVRDTTSDLLLDMCGGFFGILYAERFFRGN